MFLLCPTLPQSESRTHRGPTIFKIKACGKGGGIPPTDLTDFLLGNAPQDGVELEVLAARQQLVDGVKLRAVAHVLVDFVHL